jgi:hypothetical protein
MKIGKSNSRTADTASPEKGETGEPSTLFEGGLFGGDGLFALLVGAVRHGLFLGRLFLVRLRGFITHDF